MNQTKYIGMDVHQATISVAVMDSTGKLILESTLETKADRCSETGRAFARQLSLPDLPRRERRTHFERAGPQLSDDHQRSDAGDESNQGVVPKLGHSLCRASRVATASSCGMVGQDRRTGSSPASRAALPATGCVGAFAAGSATRSAGGEPETSGGEITPPDSLSGPDSFRVAGGAARDTASFSHQATAMGL